jgi:predicted ArsR family transcriptional regulator
MSTTTLQEQARALGDPTRHAIFRYLVDAGRPLGVAELNEEFPLNHNAIRQHLAKLVAAGLVVESKAPHRGRGRPRLVYEPSVAADAPWGPTGPYERLSRLLVEIIKTGRTPQEVGRQSAGELLTRPASGDVIADLTEAMARHGFAPEVKTRGDRIDIVLQQCPFASTAIADRATVCALHLGMAEGLAEGSSVEVLELVGHDPRRAGCRLRLQVTASSPTAPPARLVLRGRPASAG